MSRDVMSYNEFISQYVRYDPETNNFFLQREGLSDLIDTTKIRDICHKYYVAYLLENEVDTNTLLDTIIKLNR